MFDQLAKRYMSDLGTTFGVFVVVWFEATNMDKTCYRPVWATKAEAIADLNAQAEAIARETRGAIHIATRVVDASLR